MKLSWPLIGSIWNRAASAPLMANLVPQKGDSEASTSATEKLFSCSVSETAPTDAASIRFEIRLGHDRGCDEIDRRIHTAARI